MSLSAHVLLSRSLAPVMLALTAACTGGEPPKTSEADASGASESPAEAPTAAREKRKVLACELVSTEEIGRILSRTVYSTMPTENPLYCMWNMRSLPGIIADVRVYFDPNPIDADGAIDAVVRRGGTRVEALVDGAAIELRRNPDFYSITSKHDGGLLDVTVFGDATGLQPEKVIELARLVASRL